MNKLKFTEVEREVTKLFREYEKKFNLALVGNIDVEQISSFYTEEFVAANPYGVKTGKIDEDFKRNLISGYEYYRHIGTKKM